MSRKALCELGIILARYILYCITVSNVLEQAGSSLLVIEKEPQ